MEARRIAHGFFDLDGTLVDPREGIVGSIQYALQTLGAPARDPVLLERFIGPPLAGTFRILLGTDDPGRVQEAIAAYRVRFVAMGIHQNIVYEGIPEGLRALCDSGVALRVVTSKPAEYAERIVDARGLRPYFAGVHGSTLDGERTEKGALIRHVLESERLSPGSVVMVGDRVHDVVGARENGVACVAVRWGYGSLEELHAARPDAIVNTVAELLAYFCARTGGADRLSAKGDDIQGMTMGAREGVFSRTFRSGRPV
jgi:phosphoglycolate phosphatase